MSGRRQSRRSRLRARGLLAVLLLVAGAVASYQWRRARSDRRREIARLVGDLGKISMGGEPEVQPEAFGRFGEHAVPALVEVLESPESSPVMRGQALRALGHLGVAEATPVLVEWAHSEDPAAREAAIGALGEMASPEAVGCLLDLLERGRARRDAIRALGRARATEARGPLLAVLGEFGAPQSGQPKGRDDDDVELACVAAEALGRVGGPDAREALLPLLDSPETRWSAAAGLAWLGEEGGFDILLRESMAGEEPEAWQRTMDLLVEMGPSAHPHLVAALSADVPAAALSRVAALAGHAGVAEAAAPLSDILADGDQPLSLRETAADALGEIGSGDALEALLAEASSAPPPLRRSIEFGLVKVQSAEIEGILRAKLESDEPVERRVAARLLGLRGVKAAAPDLIQALRDEDTETRLHAVKALGTIGDPSAAPAVGELATSDPDPEVRRKAEATLRRLRAGQRQ